MKDLKIREKIGVIGVGNMGAAILEGLFKKKIAAPSQVWACDKIKEKASEFAKRFKTQIAPHPASVVANTPIILLAVKPQDLAELSSALEPNLTPKHILISILAGTPIVKIREIAGEKALVVRAMPNLGAKVGEAITALAGSHPRSLEIAEKIFSGCGKTIFLEEKYFDLVTAVSGSGPAYFFLMMEMLTEFANREGLSEADARTLAIQTAVGAAHLARSSPLSPQELRKMVTSKGGTTEAALTVLEAKRFHGVFHEALEAALNRGRELSRR